MSVTFFGHGDIEYTDMIKQRLYDKVEKLIKEGENKFFLGGYGRFDLMSANVVKSLKKIYPHIQSVLIIPYLDRKYNMDLYDYSVYPPIENVPKRFAILKRNEYMINNSDIIIAYIEHNWGGAAKAFSFALRKKKKIYNIAEEETINSDKKTSPKIELSKGVL